MIVKECQKLDIYIKNVRNFCVQNSCKLQELGHKVLTLYEHNLYTGYRLPKMYC